ncbi:MAG: hypothetical protein ACRCX7_02555 [Cetobacterium sp.]|uniref:hypothetical protein n=1 Tax=Cetobacterium sp. TaxID=2071632 RepID=UPI003F302640
MKTSVKFAREHELVKLPTKRSEDAGYDLYVDPKWLNEQADKAVVIYPNQTVMIPTGLRSVIKPSYYAQVQERGSTGVKGMKYGAGVIDSSYRGVWNVVLTNCDRKPIIITTESNFDRIMEDGLKVLQEKHPEDEITKEKVRGLYTFYSSSKGIAQFVLLPVPQVRIDEVTVEELMEFESERMENKLGSTNVE